MPPTLSYKSSYTSDALCNQFMREILRFVEQPRQCSYLPEETASLEVRFIADMSPAEYADLLARGYRRFGSQVFRPACENCQKCQSVRVLVQQFTPNAGERRILQKNKNIRAELKPLFASTDHVELYNLYHRFMNEHRGWPLQQTTLEAYRLEFLSGARNSGRQWLYFEEDKLMGVALMDEAPGAISLVYFFYHPGWRAKSPGTFSILNQILYAKASNLQYAYLGYWIEACPSMSYKGRFRPRQILIRDPAHDAFPSWE
jgi:leucyl-tRNA---protein transferase